MTLIRLLSLVLALLVLAPVSAGEYVLDWKTDKEPVSYQPGEEMVFTLRLLKDGKPQNEKLLRWKRLGDDGKQESGETRFTDAVPLVIQTSLKEPGFVRIEVLAFEKDGTTPLKTGKGSPVKFMGGAGVLPVLLTPAPEPADFDAFWARQKAKLATVPCVAKLVEITVMDPNFLGYDVRVDCPGGKQVSGYLTLPKGAAPKSLSGRLGFRGYGISSAEASCFPGHITFQINAHGIENGREPEYYTGLEKGALKGYAFHDEENADPTTAYFSSMMLRVLRAVEYLKSRPEWNQKNLFSIGYSQGALQAITAAAMDPAVTNCYLGNIWCCDLKGFRSDALKGWRPKWAAGLGYYDPVNLARRVNCPVTLTSGLGDDICPAAGISLLYNNLPGVKKIEYIQGGTHFGSSPDAQRQFLQRPEKK